MLTQDDLQAIRVIVKEEVDAAEKRLHGRMDELNGRIETVDKKIDQGIADLIDLFHETWKYYDKQGAEIKAELHAERCKQLEERVAKLEKQQASQHS